MQILYFLLLKNITTRFDVDKTLVSDMKKTIQTIANACFNGEVEQISEVRCDNPKQFVTQHFCDDDGDNSASIWAFKGFFCNNGTFPSDNVAECVNHSLPCSNAYELTSDEIVDILLLSVAITAFIIAAFCFIYKLRQLCQKENNRYAGVKNFFTLTYGRTTGFFKETCCSGNETKPLISTQKNGFLEEEKATASSWYERIKGFFNCFSSEENNTARETIHAL